MLMAEAARPLWIPTQPLDSATEFRKRVSSCGAYSQAERNPCFRPEIPYIGSSGIRCGNSRTATCHVGGGGGGGEERGGMVAAAGDKKGTGLGSVRAKT